MPTAPPADGTPAPADAPLDDAAYKAGLTAMLRGEQPAAAAAAVAAGEDKPAEEKPPAEAAKDETEDEVVEEGGDDQVEDEDDGETEDEPVDKDALRKLQKEKRTFETYKAGVLAHERAVKEREQWVEKGERELKGFFAELNANAVDALLRHKFIGEEDFKFYAQQFHLLSPEGLKDPRSRPEAERLRKERDRDASARAAEARVAKLEQERAAEKERAEEDRAANDYVARIDSSMPVFKAKTPLLATAMKADPASTKRELYLVAHELATANGGQFADPGKVLLTWEKRQRALIARLGLSTPAAAPATQTKAKPQTAAKQQGQGQKGKDGAPAAEEPEADPDVAKSDDEYRAELRKRLRR